MILLKVTIECNTGSHQYSQIVVAVVFQIRSDVTKGWDTYPWRKLNICLQAILEQHCHSMLVTNRHIIFLCSQFKMYVIVCTVVLKEAASQTGMSMTCWDMSQTDRQIDRQCSLHDVNNTHYHLMLARCHMYIALLPSLRIRLITLLHVVAFSCHQLRWSSVSFTQN